MCECECKAGNEGATRLGRLEPIAHKGLAHLKAHQSEDCIWNTYIKV